MLLAQISLWQSTGTLWLIIRFFIYTRLLWRFRAATGQGDHWILTRFRKILEGHSRLSSHLSGVLGVLRWRSIVHVLWILPASFLIMDVHLLRLTAWFPLLYWISCATVSFTSLPLVQYWSRQRFHLIITLLLLLDNRWHRWIVAHLVRRKVIVEHCIIFNTRTLCILPTASA